MSDLGFPVNFTEERTSAQIERPGTIFVDPDWYRQFCSTNPVWILHGWNGLPLQKRKKRAQCYFDFDLKKDVLEKIVKLEDFELKRLVNLYLGFQDIFLFSQPERFPLVLYTKEYNRFMRWVISVDVYHPGETTRQWKCFTTLMKWKATRSITDEPDRPSSFPGIPRHGSLPATLPKFWRAICPWLGNIWEKGVNTKMECTRLAHFLTARNLPAGTVSDREKALIDHAEVLCNTPAIIVPERVYLLRELAFQFGRQLKGDRPVSLSDAHASLTNSASIDSSIRQGGRAADVREKFRKWLSTVPDKTEHKTTWFGKPYWLEAGIPRWRTMCRTKIGPEGRPGDSAPILDVDFTPGKYRYEDPLYCLDGFTGYQLFQWAIEEGIETRTLVGTPYQSDESFTFFRPPGIRASAIGEPGGKSRIVTVGEDWLTIFLQPLTHALVGILKQDPSARAGLSRGWQGFEYIKAWSTKDESQKPLPEERYILTSDLKTATDYCPREYSEALLQGFFAGLDLNGPLVDAYIAVLTGPRIYTGPVERYIDMYTSRGVLMGDPGAKVVLSLFNRVAEMEAMLRYSIREFSPRPSIKYLIKRLRENGVPNSRFRLFAYTGDDHVAVGPVSYLREITRSHIRNGMKVSTSSNFISDRLGIYCEEFLFIGDSQTWNCWGRQIPLMKQQYLENPHVDSLKIRLFSLCTKEFEGKDETNPAVGMASNLRGMIAWFAEGWETTRPLCSYRFAQRMRHLLPDNLLIRGLPRVLGGLEAPLFGYSEEELMAEWNRVPEIIRKAIAIIREDLTGQATLLRRLLSKFSSATTARGIDLASIEEEVRCTLSSELCQAKEVSELRPEHISPLEWENLRVFDKLKLVSKQGKFIPVGEALQVVMRPYIFRDLLFPEESIAHGIDPNRNRAYRQVPWRIRIDRMVRAIQETVNQNPELSGKFSQVEASKLEEAGREIISTLSLPYLASIPKEVVMIPKEVVYTENLCTLSTSGIAILPLRRTRI